MSCRSATSIFRRFRSKKSSVGFLRVTAMDRNFSREKWPDPREEARNQPASEGNVLFVPLLPDGLKHFFRMCAELRIDIRQPQRLQCAASSLRIPFQELGLREA